MISFSKTQFVVLGFVMVAVLLIPVNDAFAIPDPITDITIGHPSGTIIEWDMDYNSLCADYGMCYSGFHMMTIHVASLSSNGFFNINVSLPESGAVFGGHELIKEGTYDYKLKLNTANFPDGNYRLDINFQYQPGSTLSGSSNFIIGIPSTTPSLTIQDLAQYNCDFSLINQTQNLCNGTDHYRINVVGTTTGFASNQPLTFKIMDSNGNTVSDYDNQADVSGSNFGLEAPVFYDGTFTDQYNDTFTVTICAPEFDVCDTESFTINSIVEDTTPPVDLTPPGVTPDFVGYSWGTDQWGNVNLELSMSGTTNFPTGSWILDVSDNVGVVDSACWAPSGYGGGDDPENPWDSNTQSYDFSKITNNPSGQKFAIGSTDISCAAYDAAGNRSEYNFRVVVTHDDPTGFVQYVDKPNSFGNTADSTTKIFYSANSAQSLHLLKPIADLLTASNTQGMLARDATRTLMDGALTLDDNPNNFYTGGQYTVGNTGYGIELPKPLADMLTDTNMAGIADRVNPTRSWSGNGWSVEISEDVSWLSPLNAMVKICNDQGGCQENHVMKPFADMLNESNLNQAMFERSNMKILDAGGPAASAPESAAADITPPTINSLVIYCMPFWQHGGNFVGCPGEGSGPQFHMGGTKDTSTDLTAEFIKPNGLVAQSWMGEPIFAGTSGNTEWDIASVVAPYDQMVNGIWTMKVCTTEYEMCVEENFTVSVAEWDHDTTPPVVSVPKNLNVTTTADMVLVSPSEYSSAGGTFPPTATDNVDESVQVFCNGYKPSGDLSFQYPYDDFEGENWYLGTNTITCSATDSSDNTGSASFTITVTEASTSQSITASAYLNSTSETGRTINVVGNFENHSWTKLEIRDSSNNLMQLFDSTLDTNFVLIRSEYPPEDYSSLSFNDPIPENWTGGTYTVQVQSGISSAGYSSNPIFPDSVTITVPALDSSADTTPPVLSVPSDHILYAENSSGTNQKYFSPDGTWLSSLNAYDTITNSTGTITNSTGTFTQQLGVECDTADGPNGDLHFLSLVIAGSQSSSHEGNEVWRLYSLPMGTTTLYCMATDYAGNVATASFDVTVVDSSADTTPPVLTVPANQIIYVENSLPVYDDQLGIEYAEGGIYSTQMVDIIENFSWFSSLTAFDTVTNSTGTYSQTITPSCHVPVLTGGYAGSDYSLVPHEDYTRRSVSIETTGGGSSSSSGGSIGFPMGTTTLNCMATDMAGNVATDSFTITVTVVEEGTPISVLPSDFTIIVTNSTGANYAWDTEFREKVNSLGLTFYTAVDAKNPDQTGGVTDCIWSSPPVTADCKLVYFFSNGQYGINWQDFYLNGNDCNISPWQSTLLPVGITTVTCSTLTEVYQGYTASGSFDITVTEDTGSIHTPDDTTPPTLTQNQNITLDATTTSNGAVVNYELPQVTDDESGVELGPDCSPASGSFFQTGTTEVTCYAADWAENIGTTSFTVTVNSLIAAPIEITTDVSITIGKPVYNTDEAIFVTGIATPFTENNVSIQVEDSLDNVVLVEQITPESSGIYTGIIFPNFLWSTSGNYTMSATYGNSTANTSFGFEFLEPVIDEYVSPTGITLQTDTSMYTIGDTIIIESALTDVGSGYEIGIFVEDPAGKLRAMQFLNTADSGSVLLLLKTQDNWIPGKYLVGAYDVLDNSATIRDEVYFDLVKPIPEITISPTVTTTESGDTITSYDAGDMAYFSTSLLSESTSDVLVTINVVDADDTTLGVAFFKSIIGKGDSELVLGFKIPEDAADGAAKIYVNTYTDWIDQGGIVIGSELLSEVNIDGVIVEVVEETVVEEVVEETVLPENTIPRLSTVTDITQSASFTTGSVVSYSLPLATSGVTTLDATCTPAPGSMFPIGSTQVTCTATNDVDNTGMTSFMVTINPILQTADQSLSVKVGKDSYNNLEPLFVTGSVGTVTGEPINLEVRDTQNNLISIEQVTPKESSVYSAVLTSNELWDNTGEYTIIAKYEGVIALDTFEFELVEVEEVIPEKIPTSLFIDTLDSAYVLGDVVAIGVNLVDAGAGEPILLEVRDSQNDQVLLQSLNTDSDGIAVFLHQLDSSGEPGVYSVTATSDEWNFSNSENFIAVAQIPDITIGDVTSTLQDGTEVDSFESGDMGYFQTPIISESVSDVLITVNIFDVENTPLGLAYFNSKVVDDTFDITLGLQIPQDAAPGLATVYINTYTDWVSEGGVPILEEQISFIEIVPFSTTSLTVSSEESESTTEVELVPITGNISVNTESTSYTTGNSIVISGSIQNLAEVEQPVVIIIISPDGNFITIDQVSHDSSGNYSTTVTAGGTMNSSGEYEVRAQYGVNQITSTFDFTRN